MQDALTFLDLLHAAARRDRPTLHFVLSAISPTGGRLQYEAFQVTEAEQAVRWAEGRTQVADVFISMGLYAAPPAGGRGDATQVVALPAAWIDIDVAHEHQVTKKRYPPTTAVALELLHQAPAMPSMIVDSGWGLHGYWLFEDFSLPERKRPLIRKWQARVMGGAWDYDQTGDVARIMRLPGSINHKYGDRRLCHLLDGSGVFWSVSTLLSSIQTAEAAALSVAPRSPNASEPPDIFITTALSQHLEVGPALEVVFANVPEVRAVYERTSLQAGDGSDSSYDLSLASHLDLAGWSDADTWAAVISSRREHGVKRDAIEKALRADYAQRTLAKAKLHPETVEASSSPPPAMAFPLDALPAPMCEVIDFVVRGHGFAPELAALPALCCAAAAIGASRTVDLGSGYIEHASLWATSVAPPGGGKSPAQRHVFQPLADWEARRSEGFEGEYLSWQDRYQTWVHANKTDRGPAPLQPSAPTALIKDITVEALAQALKENPRGLCAIPDELSGWLRGMGQYKQGKGNDKQQYLSIWGSDSISIRRIKSPLPLFVKTPVVSVYGGIQPDVLEVLTGGADDGFSDRFLISSTAGDCNDSTEEIPYPHRWSALVLQLVELPMGSGPMPLTAAAAAVWRQCRREYHALARDPDVHTTLHGFAAKCVAHVGRLALVLQLCGDPRSTAVDEPAVLAAHRLVLYFIDQRRWMMQSAPFSLGSARFTDALADKVLAFIKRKGGEATVRDLMQGKVAGVRAKRDCAPILARLRERGDVLIREEAVQGGVRITVTVRS